MTSVRGERTVYRETEVEREYDPPRSSYTTIKRYKVPESIARSVYDNEDTTTKDKVIIRRTERRDSSPSPARSTRTHKSHKSHRHHDHDDDYKTEYKVTEKFTERERSRAPSSHTHRDDVDIKITRTERERDPSPRRDIRYRTVYRDYSPERPRSEYRVVERDTEITRAPSPPPADRTETREWRFERERSFSPPRERERPYDIERYSKSTEYFQAPQPQPIIIRESAPQPPIIIREERREPQRIIIRREEPQYEFIERKEIVEETKDETKSLVKREEPPPPAPVPVPETKPEEDYFYERRVVERRRRSDSYDRKTELRPKDSASQYSSDDSYEYVRREKVTDEDDNRHHRRHLAEGAIAGIGAAEILRHHRKSQGEHTGGRGRNALAGAALGAVGTEAISRVRSMRSLRRNSRSRSRSDDGEPRRRRHRKHRSRSRSKSLSRRQQLGGLAAVAGVAALAGYALNKNKNKETIIVNDGHRRRSRSRRRRHSVDTYISDEEREHRDPGHRNRRIAQAGLASAAAAGIWEKVRSRSRGGRDRSKSRLRTGVPIAAAGLGGAALAGLYEKNKANKEAKRDAVIEDELGRGRHTSRSRSRSRSAPAPYGDDRSRSVDGRPGLIAYGHDPIYPESHRGQYSDEEPGHYRRRGGSRSSSPDTRRRRSRSRRRNLAEAGAAAGVAAVAAHEIGKRRERSRASRSRSRERRRPEDDYYEDRRADDPYSPPPMGNSYPPYQNQDPYAQQAYPGANYFPPPPNGETSGYVEPQPAYAHAQYNPADYAGQPATQAPYDHQQAYGGYSEPYPGQSHHSYAHDAQYGDEGRRGRDPENVSAPTPVNDEAPTRRESQEGDGVATRRPRSTSRVRFDLESNIAHSPDASRRKDDAKRDDPRDERRSSDNEDGKRRHRGRRHRDKGKEREGDSRGDREDRRGGKRDSTGLMHDKYDREPDEDSEATIDLPDRFDEQGNRKAEDPLAEKINDLLSGKGGAGNIFKSLAEGFLGGEQHGSGGGGGESDDGGRRRRSRR
ncbi:hypothetical protein AC578_4954 [Pseudocercospora eumusae]|uniref:DUF3824 domain-containing protein n=1 Tax=Pseudocercospora eumusae TaxID=321146 RepID=A0A139HNL3_9PEZI|nr:hypothetical protein AC578_4954 [Pseudocercospora eumusae]